MRAVLPRLATWTDRGPRGRSAGRRAALAAGLVVATALSAAMSAVMSTAVPAGATPTVPPTPLQSPAVPVLGLPVGALTVDQAEHQLDAAYRRAEVAAEAHNAAAAAAAAAAGDVAAATAAATVAHQAVARLSVAVGSQAAASYRTGGLGLTTQFLLSGDSDGFLQTLSTTQAVRERQAQQLAALRAQVDRVSARQARAVAAGQVAHEVAATRATGKALLDREAAAAQAVLDRLSVRQRAQLADRAAAATAADRAQAGVLLARAGAELAAPVTTSATRGPTGPVAGYDSSGTGGDPDAAGSNSRVPAGGGADSTVPNIGISPRSSPVPAVRNDRVAKVLAYAAAQLGDRYIWGATGPDAFDCSGLVLRAWQQAGLTLPRTSAVQAATGRHVARADLRPGDLVFFYSPISHVGLYIGGGKMINAANPRVGVTISSVDTPAYAGAVRPG